MLSACEDRATIDGALSAGASSYVVKSVESGDVAALVRHVANGAVYHAGPRVRELGAPVDRSASPDLTSREQTILAASPPA